MTTTTTGTAADRTPAITYPSLGGAPVAVHDVRAAPADPDLRGHHYNATCGGCLDEARTIAPYTDLRQAREWAGRHAAVCRALPQTAAAAADRQDRAALAHEYAARAVRLLESESATEGNPIERAQVYAAVAGVYARLSGPDVRLEHANGTAV